MRTIQEYLVGPYIQARNERLLAFAEDNLDRNPAHPVISYRYLRLLGEEMAWRMILEDFAPYFEPLMSMKEEKMHVKHGTYARTAPSEPHRPVPTIVLMPLRKNIPEPMNDWELRTCPSCGQECWFQAGDMKHIRAIFGKDLKHDRLILLCTECALKRKQEEGNDGIL